jgi:hypothetical protein
MKSFAKNNPRAAAAMCLAMFLMIVTGMLLIQPQAVAGQAASV